VRVHDVCACGVGQQAWTNGQHAESSVIQAKKNPAPAEASAGRIVLPVLGGLVIFITVHCLDIHTV
jgi:hypothetical protein